LKRQQQKKVKEDLKFLFFFQQLLNGKTKKGVFLFFCFVQERDWGSKIKSLG